MSFYCKKRRETMDEACADCEDCPGSGEDLKLNSFKKSLSLEDLPELILRRI
jgi:transcription initiation factor IIE alpha subunit